MITSPLFFPCRLLKKRKDDLVSTTMFMAFLLSSFESRVLILTAVPLTNLKLLKYLPPHHGTEDQLFGVKYFWSGATKTGRKQKRNQGAVLLGSALKSPQLHHHSGWVTPSKHLCPKCPKGSQESCNTDQRCLGIVPVVSLSHKAPTVVFCIKAQSSSVPGWSFLDWDS